MTKSGHMDPMTPKEVIELLKSTLHGPLPHDTQQRLFATLAAWAPIVEKHTSEDQASQMPQRKRGK